MSIDLNADLGEDPSEEGMARDIAMMAVLSSCNIACGGHAGDAKTMESMVAAARQYGVCAGAHPSYPDRANFGRVSVSMPIGELLSSLRTQVRELRRVTAEAGIALTHIKPHGALYNDAQDRADLADMLVDLAAESALPLVGMPGSAVEAACGRLGVAFIAEAFADRRYTAALRLQPRSQPDAVIAALDQRIDQACSLARDSRVQDIAGIWHPIHADTLCLHSDSPDALTTATAIAAALKAADIAIAPPQQIAAR